MNGNKTLTDDFERRQAFTYEQPRRDGDKLWLGVMLILLAAVLVAILVLTQPPNYPADEPAPTAIASADARTVCGWYTFHRGGRTYKRLVCRQLPPPAG